MSLGVKIGVAVLLIFCAMLISIAVTAICEVKELEAQWDEANE